MGQRNHQLSARRPHPRQHVPRRFDDVAAFDMGGQVAIPFDRLRRQKARHPDSQLDGLAQIIGHLALQNHETRQVAPPQAAQIGRDDGKARLGDHATQEGQAEIEIVIAKRAHVIAHGIHRRDGGVARAATGLARSIIPQRVALKEIAIVQQQAVPHLLLTAHCQRGDPRQPDPVAGAVAQIIVGQHMHMHVGGRKDPEQQSAGRLALTGHANRTV